MGAISHVLEDFNDAESVLEMLSALELLGLNVGEIHEAEPKAQLSREGFFLLSMLN